MSFAVSLPVRFADCDPAGIAYYPRMLALVDAAIEDWTAAAIGVTRAAMHMEQRLGLPTVDLHAVFAKPCRLGDVLDIGVTTGMLGNSSIALTVRADVAGEARYTGELKQVLMNIDTGRATPWPAAWRERLAG